MDRIKVFYVNGVKTNHKTALMQLDYLQKTFSEDKNVVELFYNPSVLYVTALIESAYSRWFYWVKPLPIVQRLANRIERAFTENALHGNKEQKIFLIGHSQGCVIICNAIRLLKRSSRQKIVAVLFAPTNTQEPLDSDVEYFLNDEDWVITNLPGNFVTKLFQYGKRLFNKRKKKKKRGKIFIRRGMGHNFIENYVSVIGEFTGVKSSWFWNCLIKKEIRDDIEGDLTGVK